MHLRICIRYSSLSVLVAVHHCIQAQCVMAGAAEGEGCQHLMPTPRGWWAVQCQTLLAIVFAQPVPAH